MFNDVDMLNKKTSKNKIKNDFRGKKVFCEMRNLKKCVRCGRLTHHGNGAFEFTFLMEFIKFSVEFRLYQGIF